MIALLESLLTLFFICWGLHVLAYAVGAAQTRPLPALGKMIGAVGRGLLWVGIGLGKGLLWASVGLCKALGFLLTAIGDRLRQLLD